MGEDGDKNALVASAVLRNLVQLSNFPPLPYVTCLNAAILLLGILFCQPKQDGSEFRPSEVAFVSIRRQ